MISGVKAVIFDAPTGNTSPWLVNQFEGTPLFFSQFSS